MSRKWGLLQPHEESVAFRLALTRQKRPGPYPRWSSLSVVEHLALAWLESRVRRASLPSLPSSPPHPSFPCSNALLASSYWRRRAR